MGSREGALKTAAARTGLTADEYNARRATGLLYCWRCQKWHPVEAFGSDAARSTARQRTCRQSVNAAEQARRGRAPAEYCTRCRYRMARCACPGGPRWRTPAEAGGGRG